MNRIRNTEYNINFNPHIYEGFKKNYGNALKGQNNSAWGNAIRNGEQLIIKLKIFLPFIFSLFFAETYGQTATIKVTIPAYFNEMRAEPLNIDSTYFTFNGISFWGYDTTLKTIPLNKGKILDTCIATFGKHTTFFLTKFKANEEYFISPNCCCNFTLQSKNCKIMGEIDKGSVLFKNKTKRELGLIVGCSYDTVKNHQQIQSLALESAMCYFNPCNIQLVEIDYFSDLYDFLYGYTSYEQCTEAENKFVLTNVLFHFMHGEKIEIVYNDKSKTSNLKLKGYLTKEECNKLRTILDSHTAGANLQFVPYQRNARITNPREQKNLVNLINLNKIVVQTKGLRVKPAMTEEGKTNIQINNK